MKRAWKFFGWIISSPRQAIFGSDDPTYIPEDWRYVSASQFFVFYVAFVVIASILTFIILLIATLATVWLTNWLFDSSLYLTWYMYVALAGLAVFVQIPTSGSVTLTVPNQHVAVLTLFGQRTAWFLLEGNYPNITGGFFIGRSTDVVDDFTTTADSPNGPGFVNMGRLSFQLWDDMKSKSTVLKNVARNAAEVLAQVLIVLQVRNPNLVLSADEPSKEAFERARTAYRSATSFFTDKDNAFVKTILVDLMMGKTVITAFINPDKAGSTTYENGSVIRDFGGKPLVEKIEDVDDRQAISEILEDRGVTEEEMRAVHPTPLRNPQREERAQREAIMKVLVERAKASFREKLENEADRDMLSHVPRVKNGKRSKARDATLLVYDKSVDQSLEQVLWPNGLVLASASVSNVQFSEKVREAASAAASEPYQAQIMLDSAIAQAKAESALITKRAEAHKKSGKEPDELDRILVAAQDNDKIKVIHTSGTGNSLAKAASIISDGKE